MDRKQADKIIRDIVSEAFNKQYGVGLNYQTTKATTFINEVSTKILDIFYSKKNKDNTDILTRYNDLKKEHDVLREQYVMLQGLTK
jgi:hypothetical protein